MCKSQLNKQASSTSRVNNRHTGGATRFIDWAVCLLIVSLLGQSMVYAAAPCVGQHAVNTEKHAGMDHSAHDGSEMNEAGKKPAQHSCCGSDPTHCAMSVSVTSALIVALDTNIERLPHSLELASITEVESIDSNPLQRPPISS